jgi:hypothetical protein
MSWLEQHTHILEKRVENDHIHYKVRLPKENAGWLTHEMMKNL